MRSLAEARLKRIQAVELLAWGYNYDEIAREVGYTNRGSAHRAVTKALAERQIEAVDALRAVEFARLDALYASYVPEAMAGDWWAAEILLKITDQRRRLYGIREIRVRKEALYGGAILVQPWLEGNAGETTHESEE